MSAETIGKRIRELREARSWSQVRLAEISGVAGPTINRIEKGLRGARGDTLKRIADALGVSLDDLMSGAIDIEHEHDLEAELLAEFRTAQNKEEILALVRTYKRLRS